MSVYILDTLTDGTVSYEQTTELDGREYLLRFDWNVRDLSWYMSIYLPDETPLACGWRCAVGSKLFEGEIDSRLPPGVLVAIDYSQQDEEAGLYDLGARVGLTYLDAAEIAALQAGTTS